MRAKRTPSLATTLPLSSVDRSTMFYRDFLRWLRRKSLCLSTIQPVPQELGIAPSRTFNEDAWISTHRICSVVYIRSNVPDRVLPAAVEVPCALKNSILGNHAAAQFGRSIHHVLPRLSALAQEEISVPLDNPASSPRNWVSPQAGPSTRTHGSVPIGFVQLCTSDQMFPTGYCQLRSRCHAR